MVLIHKHDNLIDEDKLYKNEAVDFIGLLYLERGRHEKEVYLCNIRRMEYKEGSVAEFFWDSSLRRHLDDIEMINLTIDKLIKKFNFLEKVI